MRLSLGEKRRRIVTCEMQMVPRQRKPTARVAQGNPTLCCSWLNMMGYTTPPILLPEAAIPLARPLFFWKYCGKMATDGTNRHPLASPMTTPCARIRCQYFVEILTIIKANGSMMLPKVISHRKYPASKSGPVTTPKSMRRNDCNDPIQAISDDDMFESRFCS